MKLSSAIDNYVALKRSLGAVFSVDARILRSFNRALGDISPGAIASEDCRKFAAAKAFPLALGKENINRCGASSGTSWLEDTCSGPVTRPASTNRTDFPSLHLLAR